ncbi:type III effector HrpK domain-containing protein [Pseudomonas sp. SDO528_S397]
MRITNAPFSGTGSAMQSPDAQATPDIQGGASALKSAGVQFGSMGQPVDFMSHLDKAVDDAQAGLDKLQKELDSGSESLKNQLDQLMARLFGGGDDSTAPTQGDLPQTPQAPQTPQTPQAPGGTSDVGGACPTKPVCGTAPVQGSTPVTAPPASDPVQPASDAGKFLDDSKYSSPDALKRWEPMVQNLPPDQRLQAEKELNRPIAAAQMAQEKGANGAQAMAFIKANPALATAVDTAAHGGKADGKISSNDLKAFVKKMQSESDNAGKDLASYQKANPNADAQSLQMVISASLMRANSPITAAADPKHAAGADGETKIDGCTDAAGLQALQKNNPGLGSALKQAAKTWSQPGFLNQLDQGGLSGRDLATHGPDGLFNAGNISGWIKKQAPTNGGQFAGMLSDAATINAVANTDISKLGKDVFDNPQNYTGAQKAAVMVKLQQTKMSVDAGGDLRKTGDTETALNEKIGQLQNDPDVQSYLSQAVPSQERSLIASDPALKKAVYDQMQNVNNGQALRNDMSTADKNKSKDSAAPDYSSAVNGLSAQLQLQRDLLGPDAKVPTAQQVVGNQPELKHQLQSAYRANFSEGGELHQLLGQKKADAGQALQTVNVHKAAYDEVLSDDFVQRQQPKFEQATAGELQQSKPGRSFLEKAASGDTSATAVLAMTTTDRLQNVKDKVDNAKEGVKGVKSGVDAVREVAGREASAGLGRLAAGAAVRIGAAVGAEAAGAAVASAIGVAAGPVGWAVDALLSIGLGIAAIVEAVKKHQAAKKFDHNVDPTLDQFGIPRPH